MSSFHLHSNVDVRRAQHLDSEFQVFVRSIEKRIRKEKRLATELKTEHWLDKLYNSGEQKDIRNTYAGLLLLALYRSDFSDIFRQMPPVYKLQPLPTNTKLRLKQMNLHNEIIVLKKTTDPNFSERYSHGNLTNDFTLNAAGILGYLRRYYDEAAPGRNSANNMSVFSNDRVSTRSGGVSAADITREGKVLSNGELSKQLSAQRMLVEKLQNTVAVLQEDNRRLRSSLKDSFCREKILQQRIDVIADRYKSVFSDGELTGISSPRKMRMMMERGQSVSPIRSQQEISAADHPTRYDRYSPTFNNRENFSPMPRGTRGGENVKHNNLYLADNKQYTSGGSVRYNQMQSKYNHMQSNYGSVYTSGLPFHKDYKHKDKDYSRVFEEDVYKPSYGPSFDVHVPTNKGSPMKKYYKPGQVRRYDRFEQVSPLETGQRRHNTERAGVIGVRDAFPGRIQTGDREDVFGTGNSEIPFAELTIDDLNEIHGIRPCEEKLTLMETPYDMYKAEIRKQNREVPAGSLTETPFERRAQSRELNEGEVASEAAFKNPKKAENDDFLTYLDGFTAKTKEILMTQSKSTEPKDVPKDLNPKRVLPKANPLDHTTYDTILNLEKAPRHTAKDLKPEDVPDDTANSLDPKRVLPNVVKSPNKMLKISSVSV